MNRQIAMRQLDKLARTHADRRHALLTDRGVDQTHRSRLLHEMQVEADRQAKAVVDRHYSWRESEAGRLRERWEHPGEYPAGEFRRAMVEAEALQGEAFDRHVATCARAQDKCALRAAAAVAARRLVDDSAYRSGIPVELPQSVAAYARLDHQWGQALHDYMAHTRQPVIDMEMASAQARATSPGDHPLPPPRRPADAPVDGLPPLEPARQVVPLGGVAALNGRELLGQVVDALAAPEGAPAA